MQPSTAADDAAQLLMLRPLAVNATNAAHY